jgi:hypothetical protein
MRKITYVGMCWAMTLGLVAVALGQQSTASGQAAPQKYDTIGQPGSQAPQFGATQTQPNATNADSALSQQRTLPAPAMPQERSMLSGGQQPGTPATAGDQQRGALGVWLVESGGPGVAIQRVTPGSPAEKAGLHSGDIVLQVNGRGVDTPQGAAQVVRQIPVGKSGELTIWRDGDQQRVQFTMQPARRMTAGEMGHEMGNEMNRGMGGETSHEVGYGGSETTLTDLVSRTSRLEQQLASITQELQQLRQEMTQMRAGGGAQAPGLNSDTTHAVTPEHATQPSATPPAGANATPPPPGFGQPEENPAKSAAPPAADKSAAPAATKSNSTDLFGAPPAQPKKATTPKSENKSSSDDLFK